MRGATYEVFCARTKDTYIRTDENLFDDLFDIANTDALDRRKVRRDLPKTVSTLRGIVTRQFQAAEACRTGRSKKARREARRTAQPREECPPTDVRGRCHGCPPRGRIPTTRRWRRMR